MLLPICVLGLGQTAEYESFEDAVPAHFTATRAESLSRSPWHSKQGQRSLRWDWRQGEALVIRHGIGDVSRTGGINNSNRASFAVWVYLEVPQRGMLTFEFREGRKVTGYFRFPLEFTGWRQGRPFYAAFPAGRPTMKVDNIRIAAPTTVPQGTVFLDLIKYNTLTHPGRAINPEREALWRRPLPDEQRFPKPASVTDAERAGIRKLLGPDAGPGIPEARVTALCRQVTALGIVRDERGLRGGPAIDRHYQYCGKLGEYGAKESTYWPDEHGPRWLGMEIPAPICGLAHQVAVAYRASREAGQRRRLAEAFLLLEDHLYDQGMQAGAGFHWNWWVGSAWADAVFLMRDVLAESHRLRRQCDYVLWNYGGDAVFADAASPSHMDYYHLSLRPILRACLVQVEPSEQVRWLKAFKAMLERSILQPASALKLDGCAYHHQGHYFAYARNAFGTLPPLVQELSATPWRLCPEAQERLRRAVLAQRIYCNQRDLPLSLSGRRPFGSEFYIKDVDRIDPRGMDVLARCGTPDGGRALDPELAAAYLRLVPEAANTEPYRSQGIKPEPEPNGCFVMPYAALLSHRRDNWLASVHGQSKYVWGSERDANVNRFGYFQGLGHLEILAGGTPVSAKASGRGGLGWDWRRFEGTTTPQLPLDKLAEVWGATTSPETFVGGLSHQGRQGAFAMIVRQPQAGKKPLQGRKSWFFNDERILCLGSDISCAEAEYPTQTTLCQKHLPKNKKGEFLPTCLDAADFSALPEERTLDAAKPHWFLDVQRTGYYLPAGQKVTVARRHQKSREYSDLRDTEGDFLTAWIDHGKAPTAGSYEYLVVVRTTPATMHAMAAQPPYRVLQRDRAAHIVWDTVGRRWGCALFVPQTVSPHAVAADMLPVKTVDRPCLIMAEAVRGGPWSTSVADPDLNLGTAKGQPGPAALPPRPLRITLRGGWRLLEARGTACAWRLPNASQDVRILSTGARETVVEILCQHGASYDLRFAR
jgi:chondroitin-sulfate-ABC endolyase/exolyase